MNYGPAYGSCQTVVPSGPASSAPLSRMSEVAGCSTATAATCGGLCSASGVMAGVACAGMAGGVILPPPADHAHCHQQYQQQHQQQQHQHSIGIPVGQTNATTRKRKVDEDIGMIIFEICLKIDISIYI